MAGSFSLTYSLAESYISLYKLNLMEEEPTDDKGLPQNTSTFSLGEPASIADTPASTTESLVSPVLQSTSPTHQSSTDLKCILAEEPLRHLLLPLYSGECTNKTFRSILNSLDHLSYLSGTKDLFVGQLVAALDPLCQQVVLDLNQLVDAVNKSREQEDVLAVQQLTLHLFTPSSSNQAKLLRVLKTLDYLHTQRKSSAAKKEKAVALQDAPMEVSPENQQENENQTMLSSGKKDTEDSSLKSPVQSSEWVQPLSSQGFMQVWQRLNRCLLHLQDHSKLEFVATVLLPLIECLMIVCKYRMAPLGPAAVIPTPIGLSTSNLGPLSPTMSSPIRASSSYSCLTDVWATGEDGILRGEDLFYSFTDKHRKLLNMLVRANPKLLRGSFALLIRNAKVLEFDSKRNYFNQQLHKKSAADQRHGVIQVNVRRQYIFQDSYYQLQHRAGNELKYGKLSIRFHDEEGADYGGVSREWFQELSKEMFNPNYALFAPSAEKMGVTYQPNPSSWVNPSHLLYFKFIGRVLGKSIYDGKLIDCYFTRAVYKHMLGKPVDLSDMEAIDPEYYKSLRWILDNPIDDVLDLTFSTEVEEFGQQKIVDLTPNGRNVAVTDQNKHDYVKLIVENRLTTGIREQITAFLTGFYDIVPLELVSIFNEKELELLISGVPDIDIDDWKNNAEYRGYSASSPQVQWFWRAVRSFDQEERAKLLQFTTGTSKVPLEGFANLQGIGGKQKFQIHKDFGKTDRLPSAHTCFNQLDIPVYDSYEQLKERLLVAITEGAVGFGME